MTPQDITSYLHRHIPLTAAIGAEALQRDAERLLLRAPLAPNLNHHGTAFGGSLSMLAIVAGWALVHFALHDEGIDCRLVVQNSEADFLEPGTGELLAETRRPATDWPKFLKMLRKHGRGRIGVETTIRCGAIEVLRHRGIYVAAT